MPALVYHAIKPTFGLPNLAENKFPEDYELVAKVDTNSVEKAYELTNHIDCEWWENEGVELVKQSRSTSVGDVIEIEGKLHRCEMMGWKEIQPNSHCTK
jgi:hypothetical protein